MFMVSQIKGVAIGKYVALSLIFLVNISALVLIPKANESTLSPLHLRSFSSTTFT